MLSEYPDLNLHMDLAGRWGISTLTHYSNENPPLDFYFLYSPELNYIGIENTSSKNIEDLRNNEEAREDFVTNLTNKLYYLTDSSTDFESEDQRIFILAIDLRSNFSESNKRKFLKDITSKMKHYKEIQNQPSYKELKTPSRIVDFEKNLIVYDFYLNNKKSSLVFVNICKNP